MCTLFDGVAVHYRSWFNKSIYFELSNDVVNIFDISTCSRLVVLSTTHVFNYD